jgi:hypothetical protein
VDTLEYLKERDGIVAEGLDNHRDQEAILVLSQWLMRWNISRGVMVLSPQVSIESKMFCLMLSRWWKICDALRGVMERPLGI